MRPVALAAAVLLVACSGASSSEITGPNGTSSSSSSSSSGGTVTAPATPPDSAFRGDTGGCGNVIVFRQNDDRTQVLVVKADRTKLGMEIGDSKTFDLGKLPDGLEVGVDVFPSAPREAPYCTDIAYPDAPKPTRWSAEGGSITVRLTEDTANPASQVYRATVRLSDVRLVGPDRGVAISVPFAEIANVVVGWLAG